MAFAAASPGGGPACRRREALAGPAPALLPQWRGLPLSRAAARRGDGTALRRAPGARHVARRQRVRLPRARLLVRRVGRCLPRLAAGTLRICRRAQRSVGNGLLEAAVLVLGRDSAPAPDPDVGPSAPAAGLHG